MDIIDGSGFWSVTSSGAAPSPSFSPGQVAGGIMPTRVKWRDEIIEEIQQRRLLIEDDEILLIL